MWEKMIEYFKANPVYFYILVAIVAVILLLIIILIVRAAKKSKNKKNADLSATIQPDTDTAPQTPMTQSESVAKAEVRADTAVYSESVTDVKTAAAEQTAKTPTEDKPIPSPYEEKPADLYFGKSLPEKEPQQESAEQQNDVAEESVQPKEAEKVPAQVSESNESNKPDPKETSAAETEKPIKKSAPAPSVQKENPAKNKAERANPPRKDIKDTKDAKEKTSAQRDNAPEPRQTSGRVASRSAAEKLLVVHTPEDEERKSGYTGKWVIIKRDEDSYYFELRASNGEKLLGSIDYTSLSGAKNGIKTHKTNIQRNNIVISQSKNGSYYFKLLNGSKQLLCTGESYPTKSGCESAVDSVRRFAETAVVIQQDDEE